MNTVFKSLLICFSILIVFSACEDDKKAPDGYLVGTYSLVSLSEDEISISNNNFDADLTTPVGSETTIAISSGDTIFTDQRFFQDGVDGVEGTAILNNDMTAFLEGHLFSNVTTLCNPIIILASFASDGFWSVDSVQKTFELNLDTDALDIEGLLDLDESTGVLTITYSTVDELDSTKISQATLDGAARDITPVCVPVTSTTDRIMIFKLKD